MCWLARSTFSKASESGLVPCELMANEPTEDTQKTTPKKGEPVEIPVPVKSQIMRDFEKIASGKQDGSEKD